MSNSAPSTTLEELQSKVRQFCEERDWNQFHNPKDMAISLALEAAEVMEHWQWKNSEEMSRHATDNKSEVAEELSDVLYWVLRMADRLDIDLPASFLAKMQKNAAKYPVDKAKGRHDKYTSYT